MENTQSQIELLLNEIRHATASDYAAFACVNEKQHIIRLKYAFGSRNQRYKHISLPLAKGIAGQVVRTGRPMIVDQFTPKSGDVAGEYSIFLAEGLKSMIGVPVIVKQQVIGVLLAGCRQFQHMDGKAVQTVINIAEQLSGILIKLVYECGADGQPIHYANEADHHERSNTHA